MATLLSCAALGATLIARLMPPYQFAAAISLAISSFAWGYWKQANRLQLFPPLAHLHRRQYAETWDQLAASLDDACTGVAGQKKNEDEFRTSANETIQNLLELVHIRQNDKVLEIGCGVGRIGEALAKYCASWTGADISVSMLGHASKRLRGLNNIRLVHLRRLGLAEFENRSFDAAYFTNMLMHIDEMDQWQYVKDTFRVLRPGGRIFIDIIDIDSDAGWEMFTRDASRYKYVDRPSYTPRFSTASELQTYLQRAGFEEIQVHHRSPVAIVTGTKPSE